MREIAAARREAHLTAWQTSGECSVPTNLARFEYDHRSAKVKVFIPDLNNWPAYKELTGTYAITPPETSFARTTLTAIGT